MAEENLSCYVPVPITIVSILLLVMIWHTQSRSPRSLPMTLTVP